MKESIINDLQGRFFDSENECWVTDMNRMKSMTNAELLEAYLNNEQIFGYSEQLIAVIEQIYGITLTD